MSKFKSQQIAIIYKLDPKIHNLNKILYKYFLNKLLTLKKIPFAPHFLKLLLKKNMKMQQKKSLQQNTVSLEQQMYASQENFTQPLVVMVETFRRSGAPPILRNFPNWTMCVTICNTFFLVFPNGQQTWAKLGASLQTP